MAFSLSCASVGKNLPFPNTSSSCQINPTLSLPRTNSLPFLLPTRKSKRKMKRRTLLCTLTVTASNESKSTQIQPNNASLPLSLSLSLSLSLPLQHQTKSSVTESNFFPELHRDVGNVNVGGVNNLGGNHNGNGGGGGHGDGEGNGDDNEDDGEAENGDDEFGPLLSFEEVMQETEAHGVILPADMLEAAKNGGIQKLLLLRFFEMQASAWPLGDAVKSIPLLRNRMLADPSFLFKVGTEEFPDNYRLMLRNSGRGAEEGEGFWSEFELYTADLLVGVVVNVALVGMLAPYARFGRASASQQPGVLARLQHAYDALPSSVFEAERPGCRFTVKQRIGTYFYKGVLYGAVGFACGLVGQGIANLIMTAKRSVKKSDEDVSVPPLFKSAALWGAFLAVSSNTRYQIINGLERLVEASPVARKVPPVAMAFTVGVRFANNIYGGMQFVDWARLTGCQ